MKKAFLKIVSGLLFGIGLGGALFGGGHLYSKYLTNQYLNDHIGYDESAGLAVINHSERKTDNGIIVIGAIENSGEHTWDYVRLEVEMFDKDGNFVEECNGNVDGIIKSGAKENFKITCGKSCGKTNFPEYESLSIQIKSANYIP